MASMEGITVNSVAPGFIATEMVEFLADPESGYITGEIIDINGGLYM